MVDFSAISLDNQEIIDFLKRNMRLKSIYQEIIYQKIVYQAAEEQYLTVSAEEIQAELDRIQYEHHFNHPSQMLAWLAEQMATLKDLEQQIYDQLLTQKLARHLFSSEVQHLFAQHRADFEQVLLYKITVPYESLAYELFYQIEEEEISFFEAAHTYDLSESRRLHCGYEGKQQRQELRPEITDLLFNAQIGEVLGPFKISENLYELFLVDDFIAPELTPILYEKVLNQMFEEWIEDRLDRYISNPIDTQNSESS